MRHMCLYPGTNPSIAKSPIHSNRLTLSPLRELRPPDPRSSHLLRPRFVIDSFSSCAANVHMYVGGATRNDSYWNSRKPTRRARAAEFRAKHAPMHMG